MPPDPSTQLPPLATSLVAGQLPPPQPLPQVPNGVPQLPPQQQDQVYKIDPQVLDRKAKIRIDGSSRMITKDILSQVVQFLAPFIGNGPFLSQLMQAGQTIDFPVFFKMLQDATGTQRQYPIIRPLNPQEEQRMQQPPPQARAQLMKAQADGQNRKDIMQMKLQGERERMQGEQRLRELEIQEQSARHLISEIMAEKQALMDSQGNAPAKQAEAKVKLMLGQQELKQKAQEHQMDLQHQSRQHAMDMRQQVHQNILDTQSANMHHQAEMSKVQQIMAQGAAKAAAARMQPKKPQGQNQRANTNE